MINFTLITHKIQKPFDMATVALVLLWLLVVIIWYCFQRRHLVKLGNKIPGPKGYPLIGNAMMFFGKPEKVFKDLYKIRLKYKKLAAIWIGPQLTVAIFNAQDAETILRSRHFIKADEYRLMEPWLGDGLLLSSGNKFRKNKKLIVPSLHINILKGFMEVFNEHAQYTLEKLRQEIDKEEFNIHQLLSTCTMNILLESILGVSRDAIGEQNAQLYANSVTKLCRYVHMRVYKLWWRSDIIFSLSSIKPDFDKSLKVVHDLTTQVIEKRKYDLMYTPTKNSVDEIEKKPLLDTLLDAHASNDGLMTDIEVKDEVMTMMFAGQDTTTVAIGFVLSLLGIHQHVQEKVFAELDTVFGDSQRQPTYDDIKNLKYLEMVIQESLRLYPPIPMIGKKATEDVQLENCVLPKGSSVAIVIMAIHRDSSQYSNPHIFDPDNFLPERVKERHPFSFIPFSAGFRTCLGPKYSLLLIKTLISTILRRYRIYSRLTEKDFVLAASTSLKRREGFLISIKKRDHLRPSDAINNNVCQEDTLKKVSRIEKESRQDRTCRTAVSAY